MRVLLAGDRHIQPQIGPLLVSDSTVRICRTCKDHADRTLVAAVAKYNTPSFQTTAGARKTPVVFHEVFRVRKYPTPMEIFRAVASSGQDLDITLLGKQPRFLVGSVVEVSRRKQAGVNKEGGAATVALVRGDPVSGYVYDANYILTNSCEKNLPESFLSDPNDLTEKKRRCSLEAGGSSIEDINRRRLESENARLQAAVDVQTRRASDAAKKLTEVSKRLRDSTYGLQLKEIEITAARLESELSEVSLRVSFEGAMRSELDRARSGAAAEMKRVILKHQTSHRKVRQQALETEKRLQKELGVKQTELWQQTATIDQWLHETAQQAADGCSTLHLEEKSKMKSEAESRNKAMKLEIKARADQIGQLQANLLRAEGHAVRQWQYMEKLEKDRKLMEEEAAACKARNQVLKDSLLILQKRDTQQRKFRATLRKSKANKARTQRRKEGKIRRDSEVAYAAANSSSPTSLIEMKKSSRAQSHLTERGALATLHMVTAGGIPNTRAAATIRSFDNFVSTNGSSASRLRTVPASTLARLRERGLLCAFIRDTKEMNVLLSTGVCGLQVSCDLSTFGRRELMAGNFGVGGSLVLRSAPRDIDGMYRVETFQNKYPNPLINLEGKTAEICAWAVTQMFKLRELVPSDTSVANMPGRVPSSLSLFNGDQGGENFGGWQQARKDGEGGMFKLLFCICDASGNVTERKASTLTCNVHDGHNYDGSTPFSKPFIATATSASRYLRYGQNHRSFNPLALYIAGDDIPCPVKEEGVEMANDHRLPYSKERVKEVRTIPPVTGDTRISSALTMCKKLKSISPAIVPAVVIVKGKRTNYRSCLEMIQRGGDNMRKTKKFVESMTSTSFQLNLRLTCIKKEVVMDGIFQGSERNSHVSGPMMHGPGGGLAMTRLKLKRSVIRFRFLRGRLLARCRQRLTTLLHEDTQNGMRSVIRFLVGHSSDVMTVALPRASVWGSALLMDGLPPRCRSRVAGHIVSWTANSISEFDARFGRFIQGRVLPLVMALSREYALTSSNAVNLLPADLALAVMEMNEGTCFEHKDQLKIADLTVRPVHLLEPRQFDDLPTFPTSMQPKVTVELMGLWDGYTETQRRAHPHHFRKLLNHGPLRGALQEFSEGELNPRTGKPLPLRNWPDLHEHIYGFCGPLYKATAIENEWFFSILNSFVKKGNYNAGMWRYNFEIFAAAGSISKIDSMSKSDLIEARALKKRIGEWRSDREGDERSLFHGNYTGALQAITFEDIKEATSGPAAVPRTLNRLYERHNGDWTKIGVLMIANLIRWQGGKFEGRATREREAELRGIWTSLKPPEAVLRAEAAKYSVKETRQTQKTTENDNDNSDEENSSDDEAEGEQSPNEDEAALVSRVFVDDEDGKVKRVTHVGFDANVGTVLAYYHVVGEEPVDPVDFDSTPAGELILADWADWEDGNPGRLSEEQGSTTLKPNSAQLALVGRTYEDLVDGGSYCIFDVSVRVLDTTDVRSFPWPTYIPRVVLKKLRVKEVVARWGTGRTWYRARMFCDVPTEVIKWGQRKEKRFCVCYWDSASCFLNCPEQMISEDTSMTKSDNHETMKGKWLMYDTGTGSLSDEAQSLVKVLTNAADTAVHAKMIRPYEGGCRGSEFVAAHVVRLGEDPPPGSERKSWDFESADDLLDARWASWVGTPPAVLFAQRSYIGTSLVSDDSIDAEGKSELALVEVSSSDAVAALHETAIAIPYRIRRDLRFHESASVSLDAGRGQSVAISRIRDLSEDTVLVFDISDKRVLFRAEDFFTDNDAIEMAWGCYLYPYTQVVETGTKRDEFPPGFDFDHELIEGTFPGMLPLVEVIGFVTVVTSSKYRETGEGDQLHQESAYVDDDESAQCWKFIPGKVRSGTENPHDRTPKRRRVGLV